MKTIGLIGGMSWESTELYYRWINEATRRRLGGLHSARIVMWSVDFQEIEAMQHRGDWDAAGAALADAARRLEGAGADFLLICTNTMHRVAPVVEASVRIPLLHLADATATRIIDAGYTNVGLLGTQFTMEQDFYRARLEQCGLGVIVPEATEREVVHRVIYDELCLGQVRDDSRARYLEIINHLGGRGAQAVIEGCTEITLLVKPEHTAMPLFDTTAIHAEAAVTAALE